MMWGKKAQLAIFFAFIVVLLVIIMITAVIIPVGVELNTQFFLAGEEILAQANESMAAISDATVREQVQNSTAAAMSASQTNIEVGNDLFRYSWVMMLVVTGLVVFMLTRKNVEYGQQGYI